MKKLIVFTDLDGTLLDHQDYGWAKAQEAIKALKDIQSPIIINSSKTQAEIEVLSQDLATNSPYICENGTLVIEADQSNEIRYLGMPYYKIIDHLQALRKQYEFIFTGFNDVDNETIAEMTGLSVASAALAKKRAGTEPIVWEDSNIRLKQFSQCLQKKGLCLTKGGRFYHVMSPLNKGIALKQVLKSYKFNFPDIEWVSVGLGDSDNDISMLEAVDIPVLVRNRHGKKPDTSTIKNLLITEQQGPAGWNQAVLSIIETI